MILFRISRRLCGVIASIAAALVIGCGGSGGGGSTTSTTVTTASTSSTSGTGWTATTNGTTSTTATTASTSSTATTSSTSGTAGDGPQLSASDLVLAPEDSGTTFYVSNSMFTNIRPVVFSGALDGEFAVTPDRKWVIGTLRRQDGSKGAYAFRPDGSGLRLLLTGNVIGFSISPDGEECAMSVMREDGSVRFDLVAVNLTSGQVRNICEIPTGHASSIAWDPKGRFLLYWDERDIWTVPTSGGTPAILIENGSSPNFSPDGKWLVYVKDPHSYTQPGSNLRLYNVGTSEETILHTELNLAQPQFNSSGNIVYFSHMVPTKTGEIRHMISITIAGRHLDPMVNVPSDVLYRFCVAGAPN